MSSPVAPADGTGTVDELSSALAAYRAFLANPAFVHRLDLAVLTKIAGDEKMPPRDRRQAAEALGMLYLKAVEVMARLGEPGEQIVGDWAAPKKRARKTSRKTRARKKATKKRAKRAASKGAKS